MEQETLKTILIVDDSPSVLKVISTGLTHAGGYRILTAESGQDALKIVGACIHEIDVMLIDVLMPGMTGTELAHLLAVDNPHAAVILMSGFTGENALQMNYGWAFIKKPFTPSGLIRSINAVLEQRMAGAPVRTERGYY